MALLSRLLLVEATNRQDLLDPTLYPDAYLADVFSDVQGQIARYLQFDPVLQVHTLEEGPTQFIESGPYQGRYIIELRGRPLVPGPASAIFTTLQLTYGLALAVATDVSLTYVQVNHGEGVVYTLMPGGIGAAAVTYGWTPVLSPGAAVGYVATYAAGYATGAGDPTPDGTPNTSYNAPTLPGDIRQAAILLARERIEQEVMQNMIAAAMERAAAAGTGAAALAGAPPGTYPSAQQLADWRIEYKPIAQQAAGLGARPGSSGAPGAQTLGYGTPLAQAAANRLNQWKRKDRPVLLGA